MWGEKRLCPLKRGDQHDVVWLGVVFYPTIERYEGAID